MKKVQTGGQDRTLDHSHIHKLTEKKIDAQNDGRTKAVEADSKFKIQNMVLFLYIYIYFALTGELLTT